MVATKPEAIGRHQSRHELRRGTLMEPVIARSGPATATGDPMVIERARAGDPTAFEQLIASRIDPLFRSAWAILGNEADARDATQDACLSAWRELPRLRDIERFDAWLGRILVNSCRMLLRRRGRIREIAMPDSLDLTAPTSSGPSSVDDADLVARAFDRLDPDARALLVLHHLQHEPVGRIAATLGVPVGTVKWRLYAARGALERALKGEAR